MREAPATQGHNEVDRLMKRVFDSRDATWQQLGDFILRETYTFEPEAPAGIPISGFRREYEWYVSDGVAVRSPVRFDGVDIDEERRRDYEEEWLREEQRRRRRRDSRPRTVTQLDREDAVATAIEQSWSAQVSEPLASLVDGTELARPDELARLDELRRRLETGSGVEETGDGGDMDGTVLLDTNRLEPRFVVESSYFWHQFTFEPGSYYFAGRDTVAGREVLRIEYYPTDSFDEEYDAKINRGFNKTSTITFWIDPEAHQIVRHTLDNSGLDFLPLRWLLRVDGLEASTEMAPVGDVWLPSRVTASGSVTTALGEFQVSFTTEFFDYREAETSSRLIGPRSPR